MYTLCSKSKTCNYKFLPAQIVIRPANLSSLASALVSSLHMHQPNGPIQKIVNFLGEKNHIKIFSESGNLLQSFYRSHCLPSFRSMFHVGVLLSVNHMRKHHVDDKKKTYKEQEEANIKLTKTNRKWKIRKRNYQGCEAHVHNDQKISPKIYILTLI